MEDGHGVGRLPRNMNLFPRLGCIVGVAEYVGIVNLSIPAHGGRPGAYSYSPRSDEPTEGTLRTGYCDRKIDVTDKRNSNSDILVRDVNFSESEISGIYGRDGPTTHTVRRLTPPGI